MMVDDELLREFLLESCENLNRLDQDFIALEKQPSDRERLGSIFRTIHTIKGTSGFFGFTKLEALTHAGEALLARLREGQLTLDAVITSSLLAMVDGVRDILASIESSQVEGSQDITALVADLAKSGDRTTNESAKSEPAIQETTEPEAGPLTLLADSSIRVDVALLDHVMNVVGELVLARNQLLQFGSTVPDPIFAKASQRLNLLTTELQEGIMKTRMQPIGNVTSKLPRVVRDLAHACGKQVYLEIVGTETELDRTIIEAIKDPLTHIIRNAVDHGIESPLQRRTAGKAETGRLHLRAFHEGGQVNIEVSDDGAGLDLTKIRARAVARGLLTAERAAQLSERETMHLVFEPGFSTADKVTNVSGRGVGMDVVRTNIEKIGGAVDLSSRFGFGTTLRIKIPLTLAIIPALVVTSGRERFAIPQVNLLELVRLDGVEAKKGIEHVQGATVCRLRGNLLPLVFLDRALELGSAPRPADEPINIVVLQADDRQFGLVVDTIRNTEEIVVKPLGKELKGIGVFAGATIMGDGRIALILDVLGVARHTGLVGAARERLLSEASADAAADAGTTDSILLFRVGDRGQMAIPLSKVARIEEFDRAAVEETLGSDVVQYRGEILPLVALNRFFGRPAASSSLGPLQVIVHSDAAGRSVGLVVDQILDIVEEDVGTHTGPSRLGILGAIVVRGKVAELLDVECITRSARAA